MLRAKYDSQMIQFLLNLSFLEQELFVDYDSVESFIRKNRSFSRSVLQNTCKHVNLSAIRHGENVLISISLTIKVAGKNTNILVIILINNTDLQLLKD